MTDRVAPNPHSPYATADPQYRHIFPSPIFFPTPNPGGLTVTACEGLAVVPEGLIETEPGAPLPDGLCPACLAVMQGGTPPKRPSSECGDCGSATWHGALCALCRQEKHGAWWPTRDTAALTADREQQIRDSIPTVYGPPWTVHPNMTDSTWRVMYATDNPLVGLVCEVPDYGAHLAEFIAEARAAVPELLAEIVRLRAQRKYLLGVLAKRDAATGAGDRAVREFLAANPDEDVEALSGPVAEPSSEACGRCRKPFDPADTAFDGRARYYLTPYCRRCVDLCRDNNIADHRCVICA